MTYYSVLPFFVLVSVHCSVTILPWLVPVNILSYLELFNSFQFVSKFLIPLLVSSNSSSFRNMLCIYLQVYIIMFVFVFLSMLHILVKTCDLCLNESDFLDEHDVFHLYLYIHLPENDKFHSSL
jgi:hypothetical protein